MKLILPLPVDCFPKICITMSDICITASFENKPNIALINYLGVKRSVVGWLSVVGRLELHDVGSGRLLDLLLRQVRVLPTVFLLKAVKAHIMKSHES